MGLSASCSLPLQLDIIGVTSVYFPPMLDIARSVLCGRKTIKSPFPLESHKNGPDTWPANDLKRDTESVGLIF